MEHVKLENPHDNVIYLFQLPDPNSYQFGLGLPEYTAKKDSKAILVKWWKSEVWEVYDEAFVMMLNYFNVKMTLNHFYGTKDVNVIISSMTEFDEIDASILKFIKEKEDKRILELENEKVAKNRNDTDILFLLRYKLNTTRLWWGSWDSDRGEDIKDATFERAILVTKYAINENFVTTNGDLMKHLIDYRNHLQAKYPSMPLYFRMSGCFFLFVLTEEKYKEMLK